MFVLLVGYLTIMTVSVIAFIMAVNSIPWNHIANLFKSKRQRNHVCDVCDVCENSHKKPRDRLHGIPSKKPHIKLHEPCDMRDIPSDRPHYVSDISCINHKINGTMPDYILKPNIFSGFPIDRQTESILKEYDITKSQIIQKLESVVKKCYTDMSRSDDKFPTNSNTEEYEFDGFENMKIGRIQYKTFAKCSDGTSDKCKFVPDIEFMVKKDTQNSRIEKTSEICKNFNPGDSFRFNMLQLHRLEEHGSFGPQSDRLDPETIIVFFNLKPGVKNLKFIYQANLMMSGCTKR